MRQPKHPRSDHRRAQHPRARYLRSFIVLGISMLLVGTLWVPSAAAGGDWHFGSSFRIGDVHFRIGYHSDHRDHYYYRTRVDVGRHYYGRAHRSRGCYVRDGYHYHGKSCPLVHAYFRDFGYHADSVFSRYAPGYGDHGRYGKRHRGHRYGHRDRGYHGRGYGHRDRHRGHHRGHHGKHRHHPRRGGYCPYH